MKTSTAPAKALADPHLAKTTLNALQGRIRDRANIMPVKNYQKGGPSGRGKGKSFTFKVRSLDTDGKVDPKGKTFAMNVRCGDKPRAKGSSKVCQVASKLAESAFNRLADADDSDEERKRREKEDRARARATKKGAKSSTK